MIKRGKTHAPSKFGAWLSRVPAPRLLYPLYLARQLYLDQREIGIPSLPEALDGLRVAYVSDIHFGCFLSEERVRELAERVNALDADLLILGGDYGDGPIAYERFWRVVPDFHARYGVCGVLGNHDRQDGRLKMLVASMRRRGVIPLVNDTLRLEINGSTVAVCGPDDCYHGAPNYDKLARQARGADLVIFAPHSPDALKDAYAVSPRPFFHLALCGHMHGGQIAPFGLNLHTASRRGYRYGARYRTGVIREKGVTVVVSNGVGTTWMPLRLGAKPQYHLFTMRKIK